jgi:nucleoside-diphosphate-sugar epimerase
MELSNKKLLITGIDSFVGLRAAEMAVERGMRVRGLTSPSEASSSDYANQAEALGIEIITGSVTDSDILRQACAGIDIIWHTEVLIDFDAPSSLIQKINVDYPLNVASQAKLSGVRTFLHLSHVVVYGNRFPDQVTEQTTLPPAETALHQSRIDAEQQLLNIYKQHPELGIVIIRAGDIYGWGAPYTVMQPLQFMQEGKFFLVNGGHGIFNHVHIDNLVDSLALATEQEAYGEIFNITDGASTTWREFYTQLAEIADQPSPASMPAFAIKAALKLRGKELGISEPAIDWLSRKHAYSIDKARHQLGYVPRVSLKEGMAQLKRELQQTDIAEHLELAR